MNVFWAQARLQRLPPGTRLSLLCGRVRRRFESIPFATASSLSNSDSQTWRDRWSAALWPASYGGWWAGPDSVSDDIVFSSRVGANVMDKLTMDMADRAALPIEQGSTIGWVRGPTGEGIDRFRFDPHEFPAATPFYIRRIKLAALDHVAIGGTYYDPLDRQQEQRNRQSLLRHRSQPVERAYAHWDGGNVGWLLCLDGPCLSRRRIPNLRGGRRWPGQRQQHVCSLADCRRPGPAAAAGEFQDPQLDLEYRCSCQPRGPFGAA